MKVILVALGKANINRPNGVNRVVHSLACSLPGRDIETAVWGLTATPEAPTPGRPYPLRLFRAARLPFAVPKDFKKALRDLDGDTIIHLHGALIPVFSSIAALAIEQGVPVVVTPHSSLSRQALQRHSLRKKIYIALFEKRHLQRVDRVQALTSSEATDIRNLAPDAAISIIPNGVDFQKEDTRPPAETTEEPLFGYIGRIERYQKGLDILLDGFAMHRQHSGTGRLLIVGKGPDLDWMRGRIRELDIENSVSLAGEVFDPDLSRTRSTFTASVHPSRWEGVAMSMLESLAAGIPVIASDGTNLSDAILGYGAGWRIADNDPKALAAAMAAVERAHASGTLDGYRRSARRLAREEHSWDRVTRRLVKEVYNQIAHR